MLGLGRVPGVLRLDDELVTRRRQHLVQLDEPHQLQLVQLVHVLDGLEHQLGVVGPCADRWRADRERTDAARRWAGARADRREGGGDRMYEVRTRYVLISLYCTGRRQTSAVIYRRQPILCYK